jgi:probable rRNA maturation factor
LRAQDGKIEEAESSWVAKIEQNHELLDDCISQMVQMGRCVVKKDQGKWGFSTRTYTLKGLRDSSWVGFAMRVTAAESAFTYHQSIRDGLVAASKRDDLPRMILLDPDQPEAAQGFPQIAAETPRRAAVPTRPTLLRYLREAQAAVGLKGEVSVLLTTDKGIRALNRRFRGKNKATDVLSFPADPGFGIAGDLAISVETAARQAAEQGHRLSLELRVLMLHGLLHLAGYDHEADAGEMAQKESRLRAKLKLPLGLIERVEGPKIAGKAGKARR